MSKAAMAHARQDEMDIAVLNGEEGEEQDAILWMEGYVYVWMYTTVKC